MLLTADQRKLMSEARIARTLDVLEDCKMILSQIKGLPQPELNSDKRYVQDRCNALLLEWRGLN